MKFGNKFVILQV